MVTNITGSLKRVTSRFLYFVMITSLKIISANDTNWHKPLYIDQEHHPVAIRSITFVIPAILVHKLRSIG
jgi:hypothetical protein